MKQEIAEQLPEETIKALYAYLEKNPQDSKKAIKIFSPFFDISKRYENSFFLKLWESTLSGNSYTPDQKQKMQCLIRKNWTDPLRSYNIEPSSFELFCQKAKDLRTIQEKAALFPKNTTLFPIQKELDVFKMVAEASHRHYAKDLASKRSSILKEQINSYPNEMQISVLQALDDYGFTLGNYLELNKKFPLYSFSDTTLKDRIRQELEDHGLVCLGDLISQGIISSDFPTPLEILQNLGRFLKGEKLEKKIEMNTFIPPSQSRLAMVFNVVLTLNTLALQILFAPIPVSLGVATGFMLKDWNLIFSFIKPFIEPSEDIEDIEKFFPMFKQLSIEFFSLFAKPKSAQTGLFSSSTTTQKCRQIWQQLVLINHNFLLNSSPSSFLINSFKNGILQGQNLAEFWRQYSLHVPSNAVKKESA